MAPHPETVSLVDAWLLEHGIDPATVQRENGGSSISFKVTVEQASRMLNAEYGVYRHEKSSDYVVRTQAYSLPRVLHGHVGVVSPTTYFGTVKSMRHTHHLEPETPLFQTSNFITTEALAAAGPVPSSCNSAITPACLRALYNTTSYVPQAIDQHSLGVAGYLDEYANNADLQVSPLIYFAWICCSLCFLVDLLQAIQDGCYGTQVPDCPGEWRQERSEQAWC